MKLEKIVNIFIASIFTFILFGVSAAQNGIITFDDGTTVVIRSVTKPPKSLQIIAGNLYSNHSDNLIHRIMTDEKNKIYFGYDLLVERQSDTGKFKVSFKPLSKKPGILVRNDIVSVNKNEARAISETNISNYKSYSAKSLPNYPKPIIVEDGDTINIDILKNPKTNTTIVDQIKIFFESSRNAYNLPDDKPPKDFSIDEVLLRIENPDIYVNEKRYKTRRTVAGNINWIYIHGKGRFIFSFRPQPNYNFKKIGVIHDKRILFEFNGDKYKFLSKSPILANGGKWNLWVMHDPSYQPKRRFEDDPFIFGAATDVKTLFQKR